MGVMHAVVLQVRSSGQQHLQVGLDGAELDVEVARIVRGNAPQVVVQRPHDGRCRREHRRSPGVGVQHRLLLVLVQDEQDGLFAVLLRVEGLTLTELESAIVAKLKPDYLKNPQLSIEVINYRPFYIIGEVKSPGSYAYVSGMRVVNAVAMAGGFSYRARENQLWITRAGSGKKEAADQNSPVLPGDVIEVPERFF